ncbi:hypothetical protein JTE90_000760 [Oedothorax gibbosus]|uniref:Retinoblastoma-associated protein n=1 Tax=Oedothorax gibbosus TaxID=931172 RepID=A0AAV6UNC1_9ARAC|nr:hypothetical protein JTE90_000760 [Oedothorax gibbosus]
MFRAKSDLVPQLSRAFSEGSSEFRNCDSLTELCLKMEAFLKEFEYFCTQLQLSTSVVVKATTCLQNIAPVYLQCGQMVSKTALFICVVFIAVQDAHSSTLDPKQDESNSHPEITVSQLLEAADINIMDFFAVTCFLKKNSTLSENAKQNLIALERKYLIVSALYDKFESMTSEIFHGDYEEPHQGSAPQAQVGGASRLLKNHRALCWMLFLVAKAKVLWHRQELLATFHLLLCCIGEVIRITPSFLLLPPFDGVVAKNESSLTILEVLSNHFRTKFEEVKAVHEGWLHVANELNIGSKFPQIEDLQSIYGQLYAQTGDVDESQFLTRDWHLLPMNSEQSFSPRKNPPASVRRTLDTAEALHTILNSAPDDLSLSLKLCLRNCSGDPTPMIQDFLNQSKLAFIEQFIQAHEGSDRNLAGRRFRLASRYYYLMLDALLKKEAERLSPPEFTSFIQNRIFHKSLLACCLEVTLMSCGSVASVNFTPVPYGRGNQAQGTVFPWILGVFDLEAFHFFKVIESFIRGAPTITMQIINHLKSIEDKILESLAWESNSSVFIGLSGNGCSSCRLKYDSPSSSNFWSPNKDTSQQAPSTPHTCHAVNLFLNKVGRLAYQRLEKLCTDLHVEKEVLANIWTCIEHVLYKKTYLLKDRHLDQLIMCCMFAVSKAMAKDMRFKAIMNCYDLMPHSSVSVYKQVLTQGKKEFIVKFYNTEFFSEMESYVMANFAKKTEGKSSSSTIISQSPLVLSPFYSLPTKKNIFVSPLQPSFKNPNEIIYQKLPSYTFGSLTQSTKMLQDLNGTLNSMSPSMKGKMETKGKKRLQFEDSEDNEQKTILSARKCLKFDQPDGGFVFPKPKSFNPVFKK